MAVTEVTTGALVTAAKGGELVVDVTAPASPTTGNIWMDTSGAVPVTRVWDGAEWQQVPTPIYTRLWSKFGNYYSGVNYAGGSGLAPDWKTINSIQGLNIPLNCGFLWRFWGISWAGGTAYVRLNINNGTQILGTAQNSVTAVSGQLVEVYIAPYSRQGYILNGGGYRGLPDTGLPYCPNVITRVDVEWVVDVSAAGTTAVDWEQAYMISGLGV